MPKVAIPSGHAGQTKDGAILCHQVRTIDLGRVASVEIAGRPQFVSEPVVRQQVRAALARQLGLDLPAVMDGGRSRRGISTTGSILGP